YPREREFESYGSRFGKRSARNAKCSAFLDLADDDPGLDFPALHALADSVFQVWHGRQHRLKRDALIPHAGERLAEHIKMAAHFAAAAAGQHQQSWRLGFATRSLLRVWPKRGELFGQGVTNKAARRALQPAIGLRLEWQ